MSDAVAGLVRQIDLLCEDDLDFRRGLIRSFIAEGDKDVARLRGAFDARDTEAVRVVAHLLKGASATLGADGLASLCGIVERVVRLGGPVDEVEGQVREIETSWTEMREGLAKVLYEETCAVGAAR